MMWSGILWLFDQGISQPSVALCPKHRQPLEVEGERGELLSQWEVLASGYFYNEKCLRCPECNERFEISAPDFKVFVRRFEGAKQAKSLKGATYINLDNIYTPKLKVEPANKDNRYSIQVEIDETPEGKKLVLYASDREDMQKGLKTQIFIDPQRKTLTWDGEKDRHPLAVFTKVVAYFRETTAEISSDSEK